MPEINSATLTPGYIPDSKSIYNGLDCCITMEVWEALTQLTNQEPVIYGFERALQAPILDIMMRGFAVDQYERQKGVHETQAKITLLREHLDVMARAVWDKPLNPRSPKQLQEFFYGAMGIKEIWTSKKGVKKLSMDRETLEKIEAYFHAMPLVACILAIRDHSKQLEVLTTEIDHDGRWRTSYNIGGTNTGRLSSSASSTGTGSNTQNVKPSLRRIFQADPGHKLCGIDLEQTESRDVGFLCGSLLHDWSYLDACEGGDLHTTTCRLIWPDLGWTGAPNEDRQIAERAFYRHFSYRDMSKRGGHGSNYLGTPFTMARHLKVPIKLMQDFQDKYFEAFPCIPRYHQWTAQQIQTTFKIETPFGRERHFFGRPNDDTTLREAIAYSPQSMTADRMNLGMWRVWHELSGEVQLLAQVHDAIYFQYPESADEAGLIERVLELLKVPLIDPTSGRTMIVPGEAKVGWNWGNHHNPTKPLGPNNAYNPNGLLKWKGADKRRRLTGSSKPL